MGSREIISCDRKIGGLEFTKVLQPSDVEGDWKWGYKTLIPLDFQTTLQILSFSWKYWGIFIQVLKGETSVETTLIY